MVRPGLETEGPVVVDGRHTGKGIDVGDGLLAQLTGEPAMPAVGELRDRLDRYPDDNLRRHRPRRHHGGELLRPHTGARPREARYAETGFADRHAPDAFEAVRIRHPAR